MDCTENSTEEKHGADSEDRMNTTKCISVLLTLDTSCLRGTEGI